MKKGKYIDLNIILAAKSHKKAIPAQSPVCSFLRNTGKKEPMQSDMVIQKMIA